MSTEVLIKDPYTNEEIDCVRLWFSYNQVSFSSDESLVIEGIYDAESRDAVSIKLRCTGCGLSAFEYFEPRNINFLEGDDFEFPGTCSECEYGQDLYSESDTEASDQEREVISNNSSAPGSPTSEEREIIDFREVLESLDLLHLHL